MNGTYGMDFGFFDTGLRVGLRLSDSQSAGAPSCSVGLARRSESVRPGREGCDELATAADPKLVEHGVKVFLQSVCRDLELIDDGGGRPTLQDQSHDATLSGREAMGCQEQ